MINHGEIHGDVAVLMQADGVTFTNTGLVSGNNVIGKNLFTFVVLILGVDNVVTNSGRIISNDASAQDWTGSSGGVNTVINTGEIIGDVAINFDRYTLGTGILDNAGTLIGTSGVAVYVERILDMTNSGDVHGDVVSFGNADALANSGVIYGDVSLGAGDDTYTARRGGATDGEVFGGAGNDILKGGSAIDILKGGTEDDELRGRKGDDRLDGGSGKDVLRGGEGEDLLKGGEGIDILKGGVGDDELRGGKGADTLTGGAGDDLLIGNNGSDTFVFAGNLALTRSLILTPPTITKRLMLARLRRSRAGPI